MGMGKMGIKGVRGREEIFLCEMKRHVEVKSPKTFSKTLF